MRLKIKGGIISVNIREGRRCGCWHVDSARGKEGLSLLSVLIFICISVKVSRLCCVACCQELFAGPESASLAV